MDATESFGTPKKLINLTRIIVLNSKAKVKFGERIIRTFITSSGVRQEDALSGVHFNLALHNVILKKSSIIWGGLKLRATYLAAVFLLNTTVSCLKLYLSCFSAYK